MRPAIVGLLACSPHSIVCPTMWLEGDCDKKISLQAQLQEIQEVKDLDNFKCAASSAATGKAGGKKQQEIKGNSSQPADGKPASRRQRQSAASFYKARPSVLPMSLRQAKPSG